MNLNLDEFNNPVQIMRNEKQPSDPLRGDFDNFGNPNGNIPADDGINVPKKDTTEKGTEPGPEALSAEPSGTTHIPSGLEVISNDQMRGQLQNPRNIVHNLEPPSDYAMYLPEVAMRDKMWKYPGMKDGAMGLSQKLTHMPFSCVYEISQNFTEEAAM